MEFDYIICGAGSAGCVVANRLSEDPATKVLLIEAGGSDRHPMLHIPKGFYFTLGNDKFAWLYKTQPFGFTKKVEVWARGKVLGGSSAINGMVYNRGWVADYDALEALGNEGWGWKEFLSVYKKLEDHQLGESDARGVGGPIPISVARKHEDVCEAVIAAAGRLGWHRSADVNEGDAERIGYVPSNIKNGFRVSAARSFLKPIVDRPNLTIMTGTRVGLLRFDGDRASGVRVSSGGSNTDHFASREVIVSLGALETPQLLERSGIGAGDVLKRAGVPVRVESPNVGEGMREHRMITFQHRLTSNVGYNRLLNSKLRQLFTGAKYLVQRDGPLAIGGYDLIAYFKSQPDLDRPDGQAFFTPLSIGPAEYSGGVTPESRPGLMAPMYALRPTSSGSIHITSGDPDGDAEIHPNYLTTDHDVETTLAIFARMRELWATEPLAGLIQNEALPGIAVQHPSDIINQAIVNGGPAYHSLGTCAMGPSDEDALDSDLRVRGTRNLRVVDASVFPTMISGNCNAPTMAMAWLASDRILAEQ